MGVGFIQRNKKWIIFLGLFGLSSYGACRVYHMPSMVKKRKRVLKLLGAFVSMAELVSNSAEAVCFVSKDVKEFLQSESDQIPNSLKQLSKFATSEEIINSITRVSEAVTVGILKGYGSKCEGEVSNKVMDWMMSKAGSGFVSVVIGTFARNLAIGFYSQSQSQEGLNVNDRSNSSAVPRWVDVVCDDRCKPVIADCIQAFVSTAVAVYLDKTMNVNFYDEIFSGLTNPKHQDKMKEVLVSLCNGAVETFVKTSHRIKADSRSDCGSSLNSAYSYVDESEYSSQRNRKDYDKVPTNLEDMRQPVDLQSDGWLSCVSSTMAVPRNRSFLLDVTGRVTFETAKSIAEFFMWKLTESLRRSASVVHEDVAERGLDVIAYIGAKSSVILTICIAFLLHILSSTQAFLPA